MKCVHFAVSVSTVYISNEMLIHCKKKKDFRSQSDIMVLLEDFILIETSIQRNVAVYTAILLRYYCCKSWSFESARIPTAIHSHLLFRREKNRTAWRVLFAWFVVFIASQLIIFAERRCWLPLLFETTKTTTWKGCAKNVDIVFSVRY